MTQQILNLHNIEELEANVQRGDLQLTNVERIRKEINDILRLRSKAEFKPLPPGAHNEGAYIKDSFPTLFKMASETSDIPEFLRQLDGILVMIAKTQKNELEYKDMTRAVGQVMFDKYVKPNVKKA